MSGAGAVAGVVGDFGPKARLAWLAQAPWVALVFGRFIAAAPSQIWRKPRPPFASTPLYAGVTWASRTAASTSRPWPSALTFGQALTTRPSGPTSQLDRMMPMYVRP